MNTIELSVPPLRKRKKDILLLAVHYAKKYSIKYNRKFEGFDDKSRSKLLNYSWPGNVRELSHIIERAVILNNSTILNPEIQDSISTEPDQNITNLASLEKRTIQKVIDSNNGNMSSSAKELGISRSTLYLKIEKYLNKLS